MAKVYNIKPASGGFGMFDHSVDAAEFEDLPTVDSYIEFVMDNNQSAEPIKEGDEEYEQVIDAHGRIYRQDGGTVIGWRDRDGFVSLELVVEGD